MNKLSSLTFALWLTAILLLPGCVAIASSAVDTAAQHKAHDIAVATPWPAARSLVPRGHILGIQTLSIEKQEIKASPATPLIRVYQFHYTLQQARLVIVNPELSLVLQTIALDTVHLPLNDAEISYATKLLETKTAVLSRLREEQVRRGQQRFTHIAELHVKASIYEPVDFQHECHRQRCALLSLFDDTNTVFSIEPVINLQTLQVSLLNKQ